jgi:carboxypeptidase T
MFKFLIGMFCSFAVSAAAPHGVRIQFDNIDQLNRADSRLERLDERIGFLGYYRIDDIDMAFIESLGVSYKIFELRTPNLPVTLELDPYYYTYSSMVDSLLLWEAEYPSIARVEIIGYTQQEQRAIYAIKISDNVAIDEDEPVLLFDGTHHACEIMGMEICLALADTLLHGFGNTPGIDSIINRCEIWIVPLINPDGNSAVHLGISLNYRKNGRDLDGDGNLYEYQCNNSWTCSTEGIDLNRNYDWYWQYGGSNVPMNYYYRGASAGSESENQAITGLVASIRPLLSLTYHSWGEVVYYPWQWSDNSAAPDSNVILEIASEYASQIPKENGFENYDPVASEGRTGEALDWQYGRYGVISFLPETVQSQDFIPETEERHDAVVNANLRGIFYLFARANGSQIRGVVMDRHTQAPLAAEIRILQAYSTRVDPRMSDSTYGRFYRLMTPGAYTLEVRSTSYPVKTISNVVVTEGQITELTIRMGSLLAGDANDNGLLNGVDVIYLVNFLKGRVPAPDPIELGDANGDCLTNGADVIYLVNYFKGGALPIPCNNLTDH